METGQAKHTSGGRQFCLLSGSYNIYLDLKKGCPVWRSLSGGLGRNQPGDLGMKVLVCGSISGHCEMVNDHPRPLEVSVGWIRSGERVVNMEVARKTLACIKELRTRKRKTLRFTGILQLSYRQFLGFEALPRFPSLGYPLYWETPLNATRPDTV